MTEDTHEITGLLRDWRSGQPEAGSRLMELVYRELHQIAAQRIRRERGGHTLQATALVHEVYLRLCGSEPIDWQNRAHFFGSRTAAAADLSRLCPPKAKRETRRGWP